MNWILIILLVLVVLIVMKFKEFRHKFGFLAIALLLLFLSLSVWHVYKDKNVNLNSLDGVVSSAKIYFSWLGSLFSNLGRISSYAIKQDWGVNITNISE